MSDEERTCGQELAASAEVPEAIAALLGHVAVNLRRHGASVGGATDAARKEATAMGEVAAGYEGLAAAGARCAALMRTFSGLEPVAHDHARFDRAAFVRWMREKIVLQRKLANMLLAHAEASERALAEVEASEADS